MKKSFIIIIAVIVALVGSIIAVSVACSNAGSNQNDSAIPYLSNDSKEWKSNYFVGEQLDLEGVVVRYYPDYENKNDYQTINVTNEMVSGFSTQTVGTYQFKVKYQSAEEVFKYRVFDKVDYDLNKTFVIANNTLATINTNQKKVSITTYNSFNDLLSQTNGTTVTSDIKIKIEAMDYGNSIISVYAEFKNGDTTYYVHWQNQNVYALTVSEKSGSLIHTSSNQIKPFSAEEVKVPASGSVYKSEYKQGKKTAYLVFGENNTATAYLTDAESITDFAQETPFETFTTENMFLNVNRIEYNKTVTNGKVCVFILENRAILRVYDAEGNFTSYNCNIQ